MFVLSGLSPVGKELSKEYEGYRTKPACVSEGDQDTGDNWHEADQMLCVGRLWQQHWSRICRAKVGLHDSMRNLHHLVLPELVFSNPMLGH